MIIGLDSATPPSALQVVAAGSAGIGIWSGYLSEIPQKDGLYRPWAPAEFTVVKALNPHPIAFTSGWDDPAAAQRDADSQGLRLCLDVERLIRDNGPWVQGWLDAAPGAGLYGTSAIHVGRRAAFHIAAWYPGYDPKTEWPPNWARPTTPCGWQWQNTHTEFGVGVDRSWLDDWFGGNELIKDWPTSDLEFLAQGMIHTLTGHTAVDQTQLDGAVSALKNSPANKVFADYSQSPEAVAWQKKLQAEGALGPFDATITPKTG